MCQPSTHQFPYRPEPQVKQLFITHQHFTCRTLIFKWETNGTGGIQSRAIGFQRMDPGAIQMRVLFRPLFHYSVRVSLWYWREIHQQGWFLHLTPQKPSTAIALWLERKTCCWFTHCFFISKKGFSLVSFFFSLLTIPKWAPDGFLSPIQKLFEFWRRAALFPVMQCNVGVFFSPNSPVAFFADVRKPLYSSQVYLERLCTLPTFCTRKSWGFFVCFFYYPHWPGSQKTNTWARRSCLDANVKKKILIVDVNVTLLDVLFPQCTLIRSRAVKPELSEWKQIRSTHFLREEKCI